MKRPSDINVAIGIGVYAFVAITAYWFFWFVVPGVVQSLTPADPGFAVYSGYELAFPLPDAFVAMAALVGVIGLWKMKDWGLLAMALVGGGSLFLGLEDLLFDLENKMFVPFSGAAAVELGILLSILAMGPTLIVLIWKHRRGLIK